MFKCYNGVVEDFNCDFDDFVVKRWLCIEVTSRYIIYGIFCVWLYYLLKKKVNLYVIILFMY